METSHTQTKIVTQLGEFEVDEGIAPLIGALHASGVITWNSCEQQDHLDGQAWVEMDLFSFIDLLDRAYERRETSELYWWVEDVCSGSMNFHADDDGEVDENDEWIRGTNLLYSVSIRFPNHLMDDLVSLLDGYEELLSG
tara:strand:- start:455 stop:874 length:420 start_codon:yes stop_codon:yes gene_type:complete